MAHQSSLFFFFSRKLTLAGFPIKHIHHKSTFLVLLSLLLLTTTFLSPTHFVTYYFLSFSAVLLYPLLHGNRFFKCIRPKPTCSTAKVAVTSPKNSRPPRPLLTPSIPTRSTISPLKFRLLTLMLLVSRQKWCFCLIFLGIEPGRWSGGLVSCTLGSVSATADLLTLADVFWHGNNSEINQRYID